MDMDGIRVFIIGMVLVSLIGGAGALALDSFQSDQNTGTASCNSSDTSGCGYAWNISKNGLTGVDNATSYFGTAGTIAGVALLLTIVIGAFYFVSRRNEEG